MLTEVTLADQPREYVSSGSVIEASLLHLFELLLQRADSGYLGLVSLSPQLLLLLVLSDFSFCSPTLGSQLEEVCADALARYTTIKNSVKED